jgi:uncharacterized delta-60 repeat protein
MRIHRRPAGCRHLTRSALVQPLERRRLLAAGALDTAFSGDGIATTGPGLSSFRAEDVCLQPDGKSVVVGTTSNGPAVIRYNVDGTIDTGFGFNGLAQISLLERGSAIALQGSSIIVVGEVGPGFENQVGVARFTASGLLDTGFGVGGLRSVDVPGTASRAHDVVVQQDSKIVLVGESDIGFGGGDDDFIAVRFTSDGAVDTPFGGGDGVTEINFTGGEDVAYGVALDYTVPATDPKYGSIFLVGKRSDGTDESRFAVAKLTPAGLPDNSFDGNGLLTTEFPSGNWSLGRDAVVQPGSKLVVTGEVRPSYESTQANFITIRYLANGAIDTSFGSNSGYTETEFGGNDAAGGIAINFAGGLIVSGQSDRRVALAAYTDNGQPDPRFGGGRQIYTQAPTPAPFGIPPAASNVKVAVTGNTITPNRRILVAGGFSGQTLRVVDVAPAVTVTAVDAEASETNSNTATFRVSRGIAGPDALRVRLNVGGTAIRPDDDRDTNDQDYNAVGIGFGALFTASTVDIPAGASSILVTITAVDDNLTEGDESATFSIASSAAYDVGSPSSASIIIRDNEPAGTPFTVSSAFLYETLPLQATFTFSQNVGASLGLSDFVITTSATTPVPTPTLSYNTTLNTATLSWSAPLADGFYGVRVKASGVFNAAGTHLNADSLNIFGVLAGDANRDGTVDFDDLVILAQNYDESGHTFSGGNFNYSADGKVDFGDLVILAQHYGVSLSTLAPVSHLAGEVKPAGRKRPSDGLLD